MTEKQSLTHKKLSRPLSSMSKKSLAILLMAQLCLTACASTNISDTKATTAIVRHVCPPVAVIPQSTQDEMAAALSVCLDPKVQLDVFEKNICNEYIFVLSGWKVSRDESMVCWAQK